MIALLLGISSLLASVGSPESAKSLSDSTAPSATNAWQRLDPKAKGTFPAPSYPAKAIREHLQRIVTVQLVVRTNGAVEEVKVSKSCGNEFLDNYTVDHVRKKWHFPPGDKRYFLWDCNYKLFTPQDPFVHEGQSKSNGTQNGKPKEN